MIRTDKAEYQRYWQSLRSDPLKFVEKVIGAKPDPQQREILKAITGDKSVAVKSGHGVGKTATAAWVIIWFLCVFPNARIPCTAPTLHQLNDILWPEIKKWVDGCALKHVLTWTKTRLFMNGYEDTWFAVPRASNKAENIQGFHGDHVLIVMDEASGIPQEITEAAEGAMTNAGALMLMIGNPTQISGTFFNAFHRDRHMYTCLTLNSEESGHVSAQYCKRIADKYGRQSDVYKVRVLGEFPEGTPDSFIKLSEIEPAIARELEGSGPWQIGVDPARYGNDNSVIFYRHGYKVYEPESFHGINTTRLTGMVSQTIKHIRKLDPDAGLITVNVDDTGVGGGVTDQLQEQELELNIQVMGQNNGGAGDDEYYNQGAAMWGNLKQMLPELDLPDIPELIAEATNRKYKVTPDGKIRLEDKDSVKKRGLPSPDHTDALSLALWDKENSGIIFL